MPAIFKEAQEAVLAAFSAKHPEVKATYVNPTPTYEDGAQLLLRNAATNSLPDVSLPGPQSSPPFCQRGIAQDLAPLLAREDLVKLGYSKPLLGLGYHAKVQCGLAFATSNPISYYNVDLLKRAGLSGTEFPKTWDEAISASKKIKALGDGMIDGIFFRWPGDDWMFSALLYGHNWHDADG